VNENTGEKDIVVSWEVQWKAPDKVEWSLSWATMTEEKAREYMKGDINYFYSVSPSLDDVEIRLVKVSKVPVETVKGINPRGGKL